MAVDPIRIPALLAGMVIMATATIAFARHPGSRLHRSFALHTLLLGLFIALFAYASVPAERWFRTYIVLALPFTALYLGYVLVTTRTHDTPTGRRRDQVAAAAFLGAATALQIWYFLDHDAFDIVEVDGQIQVGAFLWIPDLLFPASALVSLLMARAYLGERTAGPRRVWFLATVGFSLVPTYLSAAKAYEMAFDLISRSPNYQHWQTYPSFFTAQIVHLSPLFLILALLFMVWSSEPGHARTQVRADALTLSVVLGFAAATGILAGISLRPSFTVADRVPHEILYNLWNLATAGFLAYPLLKVNSVSADLSMRFSIQGGTLATALAAVSFATIETVGNFLSDKYHWMLGAAVAAVFLVLIMPLQRMAERGALRFVPHGKPVKALTDDERVRLYQEQAELAWMDGSLERKERILLDRLRERLGLSVEQASALERRALRT